jgi:hypothetical protein
LSDGAVERTTRSSDGAIERTTRLRGPGCEPKVGRAADEARREADVTKDAVRS